MPASKRPRAGDPSAPSRQVRPRLSSRLQGLPPTPDDVLSVTDKRSVVDSATPSASSLEEKNPAGPANPGIVRKRAQGASLRLPSDSDVLDGFSRLRKDGNLTDEQAFLKLITTYDVAFTTLSQISTTKLPVSFSNVKYEDVAPYVWLDPAAAGRGIRKLEVFRSRLPMDIFREIHTDVRKAAIQYGRMEDHDNEEARSRYIASFFSEIVCLFGSAIINKPEGLLDAEFTKRGKIEHHFCSLSSVSIVFIEVEKNLVSGRGKLHVIAQVLAESAACDYLNSKRRHWVPVLAILCDGEKFEFLVYDSGNKSIYASGMVTGVSDIRNQPDLLLSSLKQTTEYIFDYFLMAYINGLRSFGHQSELAALRSKSKKRKFIRKWVDALARAERAHWLCRKAAELGRENKYKEAEESAMRGVNELKESVLMVPEITSDGIPEFDADLAIMA